MRQTSPSSEAPPTASSAASPATSSTTGLPPRSDWQTLAKLLPYLWQYKWRVLIALTFMVGAKAANVSVPLLLKKLVDAMTINPNAPLETAQALLVVPVSLLVAYGLLRLSTSLFTELRELVFAKATEGATRHIALQVFEHLHALSLRFHLARQTGGMTRDIERGTRSVQSLISYSLYSIVPTFIEVAMVLTVLGTQFDAGYVWITLAALVLYISFTVVVTEWRTQFRRAMNEADSTAHSRAIDALLNYETVKYFNNEGFESKRYNDNLEKLRVIRIKNQTTLSALNAGQQIIIATALVLMLWRATQGVVDGTLTLGDLVMVNAFMIQLYIPLGFLGVLYREIKQSLTDLDKMFVLLEREREIADRPNARVLRLDSPPDVSFDAISFSYEPNRAILHGVNIHIPAGKTVAIVGPSGSGKSTLARLLYRFYDVSGGAVRINSVDVRELQQLSLRRHVGIVPQDTVLFNDSIAYNIRYGRTDASMDDVIAAAKAARIHSFIESLPQGYDTPVGERGLKLSGGEKQRVAIARTLLKNPPILIFDEATSALDSTNERAIQAEIRMAARHKTSLVIAHRLSTVVHAHEIVVLEAGSVVERGRHSDLLQAGGAYARMWALQQEDKTGDTPSDQPNRAPNSPNLAT